MINFELNITKFTVSLWVLYSIMLIHIYSQLFLIQYQSVPASAYRRKLEHQLGSDTSSVNLQTIQCPQLVLEGGTAVYSGIQVNDVVKYKCHNELALEGREVSICQENGHWSGRVPKCW